MKLSIVTTLYFSGAYLEEFILRISKAASSITDDYEIILVDDGSPDDSWSIAKRLFSTSKHLKGIELSRNYGHHKAMMVGLQHAQGDHVFLVDCDLEEDPELLIPFWKKLHENPEGVDVVYGVQESRKGGWLEKVSGTIFYQLFNFFSDVSIPENISTCRLMKSSYVKALIQFKEREIFLAGLWAIAGFKQIPFIFRKTDKTPSTYTFRKKVNILINSITSFSAKPLMHIFYMGLFIMALSGASIIRIIFRKLYYGVSIEGWASLITSIWFLGGVTIFSIGVIGIYLSKIFSESKRRPYSLIRSVLTHDDKK